MGIGCKYCNGGQCAWKLPTGAQCDDHNDCMSNKCKQYNGMKVCNGMHPQECEVGGCGAPAIPKVDCGWGDTTKACDEPGMTCQMGAGCKYCYGGQCAWKLPSGAQCDDSNDCMSNDCRNFRCSANVSPHACEVGGCGAPAIPKVDCGWGDATKACDEPGVTCQMGAGCKYCTGDHQCAWKLPNGAQCDLHNDCMSDECGRPGHDPDYRICGPIPDGTCHADGCHGQSKPAGDCGWGDGRKHAASLA